MTKKEAYEQLKDLIEDRKIFLTENEEQDKPFLKDIESIEFLIEENKNSEKITEEIKSYLNHLKNTKAIYNQIEIANYIEHMIIEVKKKRLESGKKND